MISRYRKLLYLLAGLSCMAEIIFSKTAPVLIILLGAPGAGKGTHAPALGSYLKIPHISTGDLFRQNIREKTPIGIKAQGYMDLGRLVPDQIVLDMLFSRLEQADCAHGAVLDGVPRTLAQAEAIDQKLGTTHQLSVLLLALDEALLIERICGRIACKQCGRPYHKKYAPPKRDQCDVCGGVLIQRVDDTEEVLKNRLEIYHNQTEPLIEYYKEKPGVLQKIDASQEKGRVFQDMISALSLEAIHH